MTSGRSIIFVIAAGLAVVVVMAIVLSVTAGAPPTDKPDPTPQANRKDCPSGWKPLYDSGARFSICHPSDWAPSAGTNSITMTAPSGGSNVTIGWLAGTDTTPVCVAATAPSGRSVDNKSTQKLGGADRQVCVTDAYAQASDTAPAHSTLEFRASVTSGGLLDVAGTYTDAASKAIVMQMLDSLRPT